jgi:hypothetical protein
MKPAIKPTNFDNGVMVLGRSTTNCRVRKFVITASDSLYVDIYSVLCGVIQSLGSHGPEAAKPAGSRLHSHSILGSTAREIWRQADVQCSVEFL